MKKTLLAGLMILGLGSFAHADLTWDTPYGTIGLPFQATEALVGYDAIAKQSIGGLSLPVYISPKNIVALQVGAVAPWPNNGVAVQPYLAAGHDIAREIPLLQQFESLHVNVFGRYITDEGKAGVGISASYAFVPSF